MAANLMPLKNEIIPFKIDGEEEISITEKDFKPLRKLKDEISPFKIGDIVNCHWGSNDFDQEGIVTDNLVLYDECELACIVNLKNRMPLSARFEVIPFRQIKIRG